MLRPPRKISPADLDKGVEILNSLETVKRALKLGDATSYERIKDDVFKEMTTYRRVIYIRKVAGFEHPDQKQMIAYLLQVCFERSAEDTEAR